MTLPQDGTTERWPIDVGSRVYVDDEINPYMGEVTEILDMAGGPMLRLRSDRGHLRYADPRNCRVQQQAGKRVVPKPVAETVAPYQNPFPADGE